MTLKSQFILKQNMLRNNMINKQNFFNNFYNYRKQNYLLKI